LNTKILVAENNLNVRNIIQIGLESSNYDVMLATNGQEAVEAAGSHSPRLILIDPMLPGLDGFEAVRRIRKDPGMRSVPIVAITVAFDPEIRKKCLECGFDDFISKPFSIRDLKGIVEKWLKKRPMWAEWLEERPGSKLDSARTSRKRYFEQQMENTKPRQQFLTQTIVTGTKECPACGSDSTRRSHRRNLWERSLSFVGIYPFRCKACDYRFFIFTR
jgi:CheY-like chemotaxis protein